MTDNLFLDHSAGIEYVVENFDIFEFLMEYEKRPELWDKNHRYYRNKLVRLESETTLCAILQISDLKALRRKIRSVRGSYNAIIGKVRESMQTGGEMYVTKLSWFPIADRFLRCTTDIPLEVEIPMEIRLKDSTTESVRKSKPFQKEKMQFIVADARSLSKGAKMSTEVLIEDGTYSYEELEMSQDDSTDVNETSHSIQNIKVENTHNNEYEVVTTTDNNDINDNQDEILTMTEEFLELDSNSNQSEVEEQNVYNNYNIPKKTPQKKPFYIVQNQLRNYRLYNKPYDVKKKTNTQESGTEDILNYLKDLVSESENEFAAFGKSVGVQLQNMPKELAIQLQSDIQRHITKVRLNYLKEDDGSA